MYVEGEGPSGGPFTSSRLLCRHNAAVGVSELVSIQKLFADKQCFPSHCSSQSGGGDWLGWGLGKSLIWRHPMSEDTIWTGSPSQFTNTGNFLIAAVGLLAVVVVAIMITMVLAVLVLVPLGFAFWKWMQVRCMKYELTSERIRSTQGVFSLRREELELYRVKDSSMIQPFIQRLFSLGSIVLMTSDRTDPEFVIPAIKDPNGLLDEIRKYVEIRRDQKRVREVDFE